MEILDVKDIQKTDVWTLYEQSRNYMLKFDMFSDSERNFRMYNGNQWVGLKIEGIEPVQENFIKPIVEYKTAVLNQNLWGIVFSAENYEDKEFQPQAEKLCEMLNHKASSIWERTKMDIKVRQVTVDACVDDQGVTYIYWDKKSEQIHNQILNKSDIYFGDESNPDIQSQPYILIKKRVPVITARQMAKDMGVSEDDIQYILGDNNTIEEIGDEKHDEKDENCTIVTKMYKKNGTVWFEKATQYVELQKATDSGLTRYPVATFLWTDKKGYSRGEGIVRNLIPTQLEVNKTIMRRLVVTKKTAYQQKVVQIDKINNPEALDDVGATIEVTGAIDNINQVFTTTQPAQMSPDVEKLQENLIEETRKLENAGDITTGSINPENASGKAILAVQNASQQSLNDQSARLKNFIEDIALIWLDMITVYTKKNITLEYEDTNILTGETTIIPVEVPKTALKALKTSVKIDVTPIGVYDQYAQERSLENLLLSGMFNPQRIEELKFYLNTLPDNSTMPKEKIKNVIEAQEAKQREIDKINAQAQMMNEAMNQYMNGGMELQQDVNREMANIQAQKQQLPLRVVNGGK